MRERRVHRCRQRQERGGRLGSQPEHVLAEPLCASEPALEPATDATAAAAWVTAASVICGTNGYKTVTCAGTPRPAGRSSLARRCPATGSA